MHLAEVDDRHRILHEDAALVDALEVGDELFAEAKKMAQVRYKSYLRKAAENWDE